MKRKWQEMSKKEKTIYLLLVVCIVGCVILLLAELFGWWSNARYGYALLWIFIPLLITINVWEKDRGTAKLGICATVLTIVSFILLIFHR